MVLLRLVFEPFEGELWIWGRVSKFLLAGFRVWRTLYAVFRGLGLRFYRGWVMFSKVLKAFNP